MSVGYKKPEPIILSTAEKKAAFEGGQPSEK